MISTKCRYIYVLLVVQLIALSIAFGKQPNIRFTNIQKEDGLSSNSVNDIVKDQQGFIWIATTDGLCRYDAHQQMKTFYANPDDPDQLQTSNIRSLLSDSNGNLWIGTRLGGLTTYNPLKDTWKTYRHLPDDSSSLSNDEVLDILEDSKGRIWIGTEDGLNLFLPETNSFLSFKVDKLDSSALQGEAVLSIEEDHRGFIWVGTWEGGLHLFLPNEQNIEQSTFRNFLPTAENNSHNIWKVYQDQDKRMWIGTYGKGLFFMKLPDDSSDLAHRQDWTPNFVNYYHQDHGIHSISNREIQDIYQDQDKNLWIATSNKLNYVPAEDLKKLDKEWQASTPPLLTFHKFESNTNDKSTIVNNIVTKIFQDDQNILWFATSSGISIYNWQIHQLGFTEVNIPEHYDYLENNFHVTKKGEVLIGSNNKGILKYKKTNPTFKVILDKNQSYLSTVPIRYLHSSNDTDYFFCSKNGIYHYNKETANNSFFPVPNWVKDHTINFSARSIFKENNHNRLWVGTSLGLFLLDLDSGEYRLYMHEPHDVASISDNSINDILIDSYGDLWITTYNGLNRVSRAQLLNKNLQKITFQKYKYTGSKEGIASNRLTVLEELGNQLFIGSTNGLLAYNYSEDTFVSYQENGCKSWVQAIQTTSLGDIWCSTKEGIVHFNPSTLYVNHFGKPDGLTDIEFRQGSNFIDEYGCIYFSSETGYVKFQPSHIKKNLTAPPVYVTNIKKMNPDGVWEGSMIDENILELAYNDYYLAINFAALNYNQPQKNRFAYMLEGFDEDWIYTNINNPIVYTNLDHGEYTFRIKASNNDGIWNEEGTTLSIHKKPAFWQTNLFYVALSLGLLSLIAISFWFYSNYLHQHYQAIEEYNKKLNKEIEERKRVEKVLQSKNVELSRSNHDLEQFAYIASHDLQAPLRTIKSFAGLLEKSLPEKMSERETEFFGYITKSVSNMQELVNDLLAFSRVNTQKREIQSVDLPKLLDNILLELDATLKETSAKIEIRDFPESIQADKIKLKQLLQNLISNGIKFSKQGVDPVVQVSCAEKEECWQFEVKDNGIGISPEFNKKIFQLFQRLHASSEYAGTGIGLALCKKIVEQHDGEIYVNSEVGEGSNFVFTISRMLN